MRGGGIVRVRPDGTGFEIVSRGQRNIYDVAISPELDLFTRDNTNDGGGWDVRLSFVPPGAHMGYPTLFKNFPEEMLQESLRLHAHHRTIGFNAIRANPNICGYNLTGTVDLLVDIVGFYEPRKVETAMAASDGPIKTFVLRGIKESPPYLHDGRLLTLDDTIEFFNLIMETKLTDAEKKDLLAFLYVL